MINNNFKKKQHKASTIIRTYAIETNIGLLGEKDNLPSKQTELCKPTTGGGKNNHSSWDC
jgi:hypothetical protein